MARLFPGSRAASEEATVPGTDAGTILDQDGPRRALPLGPAPEPLVLAKGGAQVAPVVNVATTSDSDGDLAPLDPGHSLVLADFLRRRSAPAKD